MRLPEILAPAGSIESVIAAVNGGADAVYFGGHQFNARRNAIGMDDEEIALAIKICHSHNVKVYVTLNILIKDSEMPDVIEMLKKYMSFSIDGLIVQDLGVIRLIRKYFPSYSLQTSTQGSVYGLEGTLFYQELGFDRVVLPREMCLKEVARIKKESNVELKIFCHGALCYAYSGQCLMSSLIGGRSGNRGLCAQPCRKQYTLKDSSGKKVKKGYLLSMKDLNTSDYMRDIAEAGVDALKIEGRMKKPEYVYGISRYYREKADAFLSESEKKKQSKLSAQTVAQLFNRDFTAGRLMGQRDVIGDKIGKNRGICIGKILRTDGKRAVIALNNNGWLHTGDGLVFGMDKGLRAEIIYNDKNQRINEAKPGSRISIPFLGRIEKNTAVWKTYDKQLMESLEKEAHKEPSMTKIPVRFTCFIKNNRPVWIKAEAQGCEVIYTSDILAKEALNKPLDYDAVAAQFAKLGNTDFVLDQVETEIDDGLFLSKGELNALRKSAVAVLENRLKPQITVPDVQLNEDIEERVKVDVPKLSLELMDLRLFEEAVHTKADELVIPVEDLENSTYYFEYAARVRSSGKKVLYKFPRIMNTDDTDTLKKLWPSPKKWPVDGVLIANTEMLHWLRYSTFYKEADYPLNVFNIQTTLALKEAGINGGVLSPELSGKEIGHLAQQSAIAPVLMVYGRQEMMISANCVLNCEHKQCTHCKRQGFYTLTDERGHDFPLWLDQRGITHLYNADTLMLKNELLRQPYIQKWRIVITDEQTANPVVDYYNALRHNRETVLFEDGNRRYTKGNYKRGVE